MLGACPARPYLWRIVPPGEFKPAGFGIYGVQEERKLLGHWSDSMYLFATTQFGEERIVVDCGGGHHGIFFNGDHETFATAEMLVVSFALPDILIGLSQCNFEHLPHVSGVPRLLRLRQL